MNTTETSNALTFKSRRAAQIAMTKAERLYENAMVLCNGAYQRGMQIEGVDPLAYFESMRANRDAAFDNGAAIYAAARAHGFYVRCYFFGPNTTRDLIAANMD